VGEYLQAQGTRHLGAADRAEAHHRHDHFDRALVMGHGSIVFEGTPDSLRADNYVRKEWLEV
jgi:branched-chain amino acid transport system ATP-binding protein